MKYLRGIFKEGFIENARIFGVFLLIYTALFAILWFTLPYIYPFAIALLIALLAQPLLSLLVERLGVNRSLASIAIIFLLFAIITGLLLWGITAAIHELRTLYNAVRAIDIAELRMQFTQVFDQIESITGPLDDDLMITARDQLLRFFTSSTATLTSVLTNALRLLSSVPMWILMLIMLVFSSFLITRDLDAMKHRVRSVFTDDMITRFHQSWTEAVRVVGRTLRAYLTLVGVTYVQVLILLTIVRMPYTLLLSGLIALADILPVFGPGLFLIPMGVYNLITGDIFSGVAILSGYIVITVVRYMLEPKLISASVGIPPLLPLMTMFVGLTSGSLGVLVYLSLMVIMMRILLTARAITMHPVRTPDEKARAASALLRRKRKRQQ